jgi:hypothetical protein
MISELEQVNHPNTNHERRYRKAAAIEVPGEESVRKIVQAIHISRGGTSSKSWQPFAADSTCTCTTFTEHVPITGLIREWPSLNPVDSCPSRR